MKGEHVHKEEECSMSLTYHGFPVVDVPSSGGYAAVTVDSYDPTQGELVQTDKVFVPQTVSADGNYFVGSGGERWPRQTPPTPTVVITDANCILRTNFPEYLEVVEITDVLDTSQVTNANLMFDGLSSLEIAPTLNLQNVRVLHAMFQDCTNLTDILNFQIPSTQRGVWYHDYKINLIYVDTHVMPPSVLRCEGGYYGVAASSLFANCTSLATVHDFGMANVSSVGGMFQNCTSLPATFPFAVNLGMVEQAYTAYQAREDFATWRQQLIDHNAPQSAEVNLFNRLIQNMFNGSSVENVTITGCSSSFFGLINADPSILGTNTAGDPINLTYQAS